VAFEVLAEGDHDGADIFDRLLLDIAREQRRCDQHEGREKKGA
jgi:hypothetical protein